MKELIIGNGFIGGATVEALSDMKGSDVHQASRRPGNGPNNHFVDLAQPESIAAVLDEVRPEVIINCAAVVRANDSKQFGMNPVHMQNLLEGVVASGISPKRIVTLGSAAEYGPVTDGDLPIAEGADLNPNSPYGQSKKDESNLALDFARDHKLPLVVARVFNPLGPGLHPSYLTSRVIDQMQSIRYGEQKPVVEVRNLDAERDYLHIADCVSAVGTLALADELPHSVYNVGSGMRTRNETVINLALYHAGMQEVEARATDTAPEQLLGSAQADISRIKELGWAPQHSLDKTMAEIVAEAGLAAADPRAA